MCSEVREALGVLAFTTGGRQPLATSEPVRGLAWKGAPASFARVTKVFTTPSSRSLLGGGLPVHLTNIRQHPDGRVSFHLGYEFQ